MNSAVSYVRLARGFVAGFEPELATAPVRGGLDEPVRDELEPAPAPVHDGPDELAHGELEPALVAPAPEPEPEPEPAGPEPGPGPEHEHEHAPAGPEHEHEPAPAGPEPEPEPEHEPAPAGPELAPAGPGLAPEPAAPESIELVAVASVEADISALELDLELEHAAVSDVVQEPAGLRQPVAQLVQGKASTEMDKSLGG